MDVKAAAQKIQNAVPGVRLSFYDYDWSLSVAHPTEQRGYIVYQAPRLDDGSDEIISDVDAVIDALKL